MPLMKNCRDSYMSLVNGMVTLKCLATGRMLGISWKCSEPLRQECKIPWTSSSWQWMVLMMGGR
jgi:hypothetical protein